MSTKQKMAPSLIADLGGTNARFALVQDDKACDIKVLRCANYPTLYDAIDDYIHKANPEIKPDSAVIDVACPVTEDRIELTNNSWSFSQSNLKKKVGLSKLLVVNDFQAIAMSLLKLTKNDYYKVGGGERVENQPKAVLGPGTGMGVSALIPTHDGWTTLSAEGGHVTISPVDEIEEEIIRMLRERYQHVSAERVISGMGLTNIYESLGIINGVELPIRDPKDITEAVIGHQDKICEQSVEIFCSLLGSLAGNLALTIGARGGVYIAGGIVPKLGEIFTKSSFRDKFEKKGRLTFYQKEIPTYVITNEFPAFIGLQALVEPMLRK